MITPDQLATLLDATQLSPLARAVDRRETDSEAARILALAESAGLVIAWTAPEGAYLAGALEAIVTTAPEDRTTRLLIDRGGLVSLPDYGPQGLTNDHADQLVRRHLAVRIDAAATIMKDDGPRWATTITVPHATFTLHAGPHPFVRGVVFALGFLPAPPAHTDGFQTRTARWVEDTFGEQTRDDLPERCDRFIEEALEFLQAVGYRRESVERAMDYVYSREAGDPMQEAGGVQVTLAGLCDHLGFDAAFAGEVELARIETMIAAVRAKNGTKPRFDAPTQAPRLALVK